MIKTASRQEVRVMKYECKYHVTGIEPAISGICYVEARSGLEISNSALCEVIIEDIDRQCGMNINTGKIWVDSVKRVEDAAEVTSEFGKIAGRCESTDKNTSMPYLVCFSVKVDGGYIKDEKELSCESLTFEAVSKFKQEIQKYCIARIDKYDGYISLDSIVICNIIPLVTPKVSIK
jgi:hypothetical protein